jgi:hypothetical protein
MRFALLSNGSEGNLRILLGWDKSTKNLLRSCALTLDECALAAEYYVTVAARMMEDLNDLLDD